MPRDDAPTVASGREQATRVALTGRRSALGLALFAIVAVVPAYALSESYLLSVLILVLANAQAASAWNLAGGLAGQMSFGHAAFFGLGAYTSAMLFTASVPFAAMALGGLVAAVCAAMIGYLCLRFRGFHFALATFALAEVMRIVARNWVGLTNGVLGIFLDADRFRILGGRFDLGKPSKVHYYLLALVLAAATVAVTAFVSRHKVGYFFQAIREDENAAQAVGINVTGYKVLALVLSGFFTALAGSSYALYAQYVSPDEVFSVSFSVKVIFITLVGGVGTIWGPVVGAVVMTALEEWLRVYFPYSHEFIYGLLIVVVMLFMPMGIVGKLRDVAVARSRKDVASAPARS